MTVTYYVLCLVQGHLHINIHHRIRQSLLSMYHLWGEFFHFSDYDMICPHDEIYGSARQCANCRCSLSYKTRGEDIEKKEERDKIEEKEEGRLRMNLQLFSEAALVDQKSSELRKGITSLQQKIEEHEYYLENPKVKWKDWDTFSEERKERELRHWRKEIRNFKESIQNRKDELVKRGEPI